MIFIDNMYVFSCDVDINRTRLDGYKILKQTKDALQKLKEDKTSTNIPGMCDEHSDELKDTQVNLIKIRRTMKSIFKECKNFHKEIKKHCYADKSFLKCKEIIANQSKCYKTLYQQIYEVEETVNSLNNNIKELYDCIKFFRGAKSKE